MTTDAGRATRTRFAVALALAGWMGAALAQQAGDGGMIVIPGRGESAQTALANAASARGANGAGAAGPGGADRTASPGGWHAPAAAQAAAAWSGRAGAASGAESAAESGDVRAATEPRTGLIVIEPGPAESNGRIPAAAPSGWHPSAAMPRAESNGGANPVPPRTGSNRSAGSASASAGWTAPPGAASQGNPAANVAPAPRVSAASRAPATTDMQRVAPVIAQDEGAAPAGRPANARAAAQSWPARDPSVAAGGVIPVSLRAQPAAASATAAGAVPAAQQDGESIRRAALAFLQQQAAGLPGKTTVTVAPAFPRGLAACTTLEPFLPSGARLWGRTTVGVRCAGERPWTIYLQAKLAVQATYYVAARQIAPGETLTAADLVARDGDLTLLPLAVITDAQQAVGATALTRVAAGLPLRRDLLKSAASVSIGQTVRVVASGQGFTISAEGSVLNNAAPGQQVRVRMAAGQIVTAIVKDAATVEIPL
ncbi:flagellar basal body P-ring formation chaperone FlgA [Burkholderia pseudomallei]|uniref:flagellar basal body P-ring formation chaperone FlgA n=1 Tax=Burkholderia pseudomallei TaxID=28450 RepID=UPI000F07F9FE|nr:flagellar basal body P-ring formation chaperone FlgA [Burkholderia pseudomallei]CAJ2961499.1 flagellar basal body P-ring biosynthesis protein FlgA [Burkholderia pseudomallei]VCJ22824.1 flagellar basal body P-ring biosynthesis protein FlgA [Burkholderia pseudomallei]